ncbi:MAG: DUF2214 family protein [Proteobacteria bacterium]|nr:DUF2214 family protein [Pseudomonadota bacterium]
MLVDAILAWFHFLLAFVLVGALVAQAFILRLPVDGRVALLLARVDLFYGISAVLLLGVSTLRVIWGAKGLSYYEGQPFFWAKIATFVVIGLVSIVPTLVFRRWSRMAAASPSFVAPPKEAKRIRGLVVAETHLIALLLAFAVLMARGIG